MKTGIIQFPALVCLLCGLFAITTAITVLIYRKKFVFFAGIIILLFAGGTLSFTTGLMNMYDSNIIYIFHFFGFSLIPLILLQFSEYILKINYHIRIKLFTLLSTFVFAFASFFQIDASHNLILISEDLFFAIVILIIIFHLSKPVLSEDEMLLHRLRRIYLVTISIFLIGELSRYFSDTNFILFSAGISAIVLTHGMILIFTSDDNRRLIEKFPRLIYILLMSFILVLSFKLLYSEFQTEYQGSLFILCLVLFSIYYMFGEVSKKPTQIRSALLVSRLLGLPIHDRIKFLEELRQWHEIKSLNYIEASQVEGDVANLNLIFHKTGSVIHKFQINEVSKVLALNPEFASGIEVAKFYLKKFESDSLFQLSENGEYLAVKYVPGLNPALYANEISAMSKIVFTMSSTNK